MFYNWGHPVADISSNTSSPGHQETVSTQVEVRTQNPGRGNEQGECTLLIIYSRRLTIENKWLNEYHMGYCHQMVSAGKGTSHSEKQITVWVFPCPITYLQGKTKKVHWIIYVLCLWCYSIFFFLWEWSRKDEDPFMSNCFDVTWPNIAICLSSSFSTRRSLDIRDELEGRP